MIRPSPSPLHDGGLIPLDQQFDNHDEFRPVVSDALSGRTAELYLEGARVSVTFESSTRLRWAATAPLLWGTEGEETYEAVEVRDGVFAITVARLAQHTSALVVLDDTRRRALVNLTTFASGGDGVVRERGAFVQVGVGAAPTELFARTEELIGKRVAHRYSTTHVFEHIYLNPNTYAFQGLAGPEAGVADVDRADYWKLGDGLYLLSWHERMQPFNGAVVIDLKGGRATGRLVGWDLIAERTLQARTGSVVTVLSETTYGDL